MVLDVSELDSESAAWVRELAGDDPAVRFPGVAVHLQQCGPCSQHFQDLLALVTG